VAAFTVVRVEDALAPFQVLGPDGAPVPAICDFLVYLSALDSSAYTLRSYAVGLGHFFDWLHQTNIHVDAVTRDTVGAYIEAFRRGSKSGACSVAPQRAGQVNLLTRKPYPAAQRQPRTINHRLSVLASFYAYRIQQAPEQGIGGERARSSPVPASSAELDGSHGMVGRDAPVRGRRAEFRRRVARQIPLALDPVLVERLIDMATSWRDKAILTLLYRTGQRIGDWSSFAGRHGVLGMTLADVDERSQTVTVRLKGARDEHRVPVADDFWPLYRRYLGHERVADSTVPAVWVGLRRGQGQPLTYAAFEASLRYIGRKLGANVNAHLFRHTVAQALVDTGGLKIAQDILGHRHVGTTADIYAVSTSRPWRRHSVWCKPSWMPHGARGVRRRSSLASPPAAHKAPRPVDTLECATSSIMMPSP
jgi:integrase/recombinase XerD